VAVLRQPPLLDEVDRLLVAGVRADALAEFPHALDLADDVVVDAHPALARKVAEADRLAAADAAPLVLADLAQRRPRTEDEDGVGSPRRSQLVLRQRPVGRAGESRADERGRVGGRPARGDP